MADSEHFRKLERMYHAAPINEYYRPKLTVGEGRAELEIPVRPEFFTPRPRCTAPSISRHWMTRRSLQ